MTYFVESFQVTSLYRGKLLIKDLPRNFSSMPSYNYIRTDIFYIRRVAGLVDAEFCVGCIQRPLN